MVPFFALQIGCARFRIEELKPSLIFSSRIVHPDLPNPDGRIQAMINGRVPFDFPILPASDGKNVYIADPERKLVRVFSSSGTVVKLIGETIDPATRGVTHVPIDIGIPGWIAAEPGGGSLYIQSRASQQEAQNKEAHDERKKIMELSAVEPTPSFILQIGEQDELVRKFGPDGTDEKPFETVLRINAAADETLYVLYTQNGKKILSQFKNGKPTYKIEGFDPSSDEEKRKMHVELEDIVPYPDGKTVLASLTYHKKNNYEFQYRKIYRIDAATGTHERIAWLDDPENFFAWIHPDGGFYMQHVDDDGMRILYKIYSPEGEYLNNLQISLFGIRAGWREVFLTLNGKIYASRISRDMFEFYEWK